MATRQANGSDEKKSGASAAAVVPAPKKGKKKVLWATESRSAGGGAALLVVAMPAGARSRHRATTASLKKKEQMPMTTTNGRHQKGPFFRIFPICRGRRKAADSKTEGQKTRISLRQQAPCAVVQVAVVFSLSLLSILVGRVPDSENGDMAHVARRDARRRLGPH